MKNWTVRQRIIASFSVVIAIFLLLSISIYFKLLSVERSAVQVKDSAAPGMYLTGAIRIAWSRHLLETQRLIMNERESGAVAAVLNDQVLGTFNSLQQQMDENWQAYQPSIVTEEGRQASLQFARYRDEYLQLHAELLDMVREKQFASASQFAQERVVPVWLQALEALNRMFSESKRVSDESVQMIVSEIGGTEFSLLLAVIGVVVAASLCGLLLLRAITQPVEQIVATLRVLGSGDLAARLDLQRYDEFNAIEVGFNNMAEEIKTLVAQAQRSAVQMTTSVTEIAATSRQQQATATETAATTTEIGATSREIAATSRDLVRTMGEVSESTEQTSILAGSGQLGLARMEEIMRQVMGAAEVVNAKLAILNEKAGNINHVVTTIVKVADQTNLLSLNAAIEAEKAGEYGRGFAVVATQVRRLADQTAVATYDIEQMVREIQSAVSAGVMGMDKFSEEVRRGNHEMDQVGDQFSQIIQQVQALAPQVLMVNEGMQAQATGAEQINQALVQLGEASGQTVESLRQAGTAIDELNQVAGSLRAGVSRFKV